MFVFGGRNESGSGKPVELLPAARTLMNAPWQAPHFFRMLFRLVSSLCHTPVP